MATIVDPRIRRQLGLPPLSYGAVTLNTAAPSFQGPAYYNQMFNRPIQDWSQFMPTNSPLAGGGGINYQNPWGYGTGGGSGWGGGYGGGGGYSGGFPGGGFMGGGGGYGGGYPGWGGGYPGQLGGGNTGGFPPWMNPGNPTAYPTDGSLPGPRPGRHHPEMYDAGGNYVGAEGGGAAEAGWTGGGAGGGGAGGVPWQDSFLGPLGNRLGWDPVYEGWQSPLLDSEGNVAINPETGKAFVQTTAPGYDYTMGESAGTQPTNAIGLLAEQVFDDDPVALATGTGLLGPNEGTINQFSTPSYGTGDPMANVNALPAVSTWSQPSMTPTTTTPVYSTQGDVPTRNVIPNVNVPNTGPPGLAAQQAAAAQAQAQAQQQAYDQNVAVQAQQAQAAAQQRYLANLDDESARQMMNMSQAQQEREAAQVEAAAMSRASGASAAQSSRMAAARSRAGGGNGGGRSGGNGGGRSGGREGGREN